MTITIWNFPRGGRGVRLFWQCEEMGLAYETKAVAFPPSAEYLALNPLGNVPFLQDGEVAINESVAIMLYLAGKYGPTPLMPSPESPAYARVLQMLVFSEASLGACVNTLLAAKFGAPEADKANWSVRMTEDRVLQFLGFIEGVLGDAPYLAGANLTLADIAISTGMGVYRGALNKTLSPRLSAYQDRLQARPAYQRAKAQQQA
jgi:glutathione S-transferase